MNCLCLARVLLRESLKGLTCYSLNEARLRNGLPMREESLGVSVGTNQW
jgi:hypothetical protein